MDITLWVRNSGHLPARGFAVQLYMDAARRNGDVGGLLAPLEKQHWFQYGGDETTIAPGVDYPIPTDLPPTYAKYLPMIAKDEAELLFDGYVVYGTGFSFEKPNRMGLDKERFCFMYGHRHQTAVTWAPCEMYSGGVDSGKDANALFDEYTKQKQNGGAQSKPSTTGKKPN